MGMRVDQFLDYPRIYLENDSRWDIKDGGLNTINMNTQI